MIKVLGLALYSSLAASTRYRIQQYILGLSTYNITLQSHNLLGDEYLRWRFSDGHLPFMELCRNACSRLSLLFDQQQFDVVILYAELFPFMPSCLEQKLLAMPYIYDFDDAFYLKYRNGKSIVTRLLLGDKSGAVMAGAAAITAGSSSLAEYARKRNKNTFLLPTVVDTEHHKPISRPQNKIFTIGWIGSPTTAPYLLQLADTLSLLGRETTLKLMVVGGKTPSIPNVDVEEIPWSENTEITLINSFDVGIMPLPDNEWTRGKCAFKLIQYMACGVPVVASRVGANIDVVSSDCGILVSNEREWSEALRFLRDQPGDRLKMGQAGRIRVEQLYSLRRNLPVFADIIRSVLA